MWSILETATGPRRVGAARLLVQVGTSRSIPLLMTMLDDPATQRAALHGLAQWMPDAELARFASRTSDVEQRKHLVRALLERRTQESTACFLGLVSSSELRPQALAIVGEMRNPPVEPLLALLESSQPGLRLAAAQALARLPQPDVAWRLSEHLGGLARQEALMALLMSRSS
ncbi:MAG TPA: HEAT repeat domain-containing protein, partial [Pirellulales bacterium]